MKKQGKLLLRNNLSDASGEGENEKDHNDIAFDYFLLPIYIVVRFIEFYQEGL
jgi:hypothetical protein